MPRAKRDQQIYKLAQYGATVTIDYDVNNPPPFWQPSSGVVIVGEHECGERVMTTGYMNPAPVRAEPRGGNLFDVDSEEYRARVAALGSAKPPGYTPKVITSEDNFPPGTDLAGLLDAGAGAAAVTEE